MNKQIKTKLLFTGAAILLVAGSFTSCDNKEEEKTEVKTEVPVTVRDSMDTAEEQPILDSKPK